MSTSLLDTNATIAQRISDNEYIREHPELNGLLGDFLQAVLKDQPENVLEYSIEYFGKDRLTTDDRDKQ